jgi:hypothetical protein
MNKALLFNELYFDYAIIALLFTIWAKVMNRFVLVNNELELDSYFRGGRGRGRFCGCRATESDFSGGSEQAGRCFGGRGGGSAAQAEYACRRFNGAGASFL